MVRAAVAMPGRKLLGLSTGAAVGIGVGAGVGGLALLGLLIWCFARFARRRRVHARFVRTLLERDGGGAGLGPSDGTKRGATGGARGTGDAGERPSGSTAPQSPSRTGSFLLPGRKKKSARSAYTVMLEEIDPELVGSPSRQGWRARDRALREPLSPQRNTPPSGSGFDDSPEARRAVEEARTRVPVALHHQPEDEHKQTGPPDVGSTLVVGGITVQVLRKIESSSASRPRWQQHARAAVVGDTEPADEQTKPALPDLTAGFQCVEVGGEGRLMALWRRLLPDSAPQEAAAVEREAALQLACASSANVARLVARDSRRSAVGSAGCAEVLLLTEFCPGGTLASWMRSQPPLLLPLQPLPPPPGAESATRATPTLTRTAHRRSQHSLDLTEVELEIYAIGEDIMGGLAAVHAAGHAVLTLSPEDIELGEDGLWKIARFAHCVRDLTTAGADAGRSSKASSRASSAGSEAEMPTWQPPQPSASRPASSAARSNGTDVADAAGSDLGDAGPNVRQQHMHAPELSQAQQSETPLWKLARVALDACCLTTRPPELLRGGGAIDCTTRAPAAPGAAIDVWMAGLIVAQVAFGTVKFSATGEFTPPRGGSESLCRLLRMAMATNPAERPSAADCSLAFAEARETCAARALSESAMSDPGRAGTDAATDSEGSV